MAEAFRSARRASSPIFIESPLGTGTWPPPLLKLNRREILRLRRPAFARANAKINRRPAPLRRTTNSRGDALKRGPTRKVLDLKLTLTFSILEWDVANHFWEDGHESEERTVCWNEYKNGGSGDGSVADGRKRGWRINRAETNASPGRQGECSGNDAKQVLLQPERADA